jgi:hypothetical protein
MKKRPYPEYISQKQRKRITLKEEIHEEIIFLKRSGKKNTKEMKLWRNPQRNHKTYPEEISQKHKSKKPEEIHKETVFQCNQ